MLFFELVILKKTFSISSVVMWFINVANLIANVVITISEPEFVSCGLIGGKTAKIPNCVQFTLIKIKEKTIKLIFEKQESAYIWFLTG